MNKSKRINIKIISFIMFLLVVLFPSFIYSIPEKKSLPKELIVGGEFLQINIKTSKLIVYLEDDYKNKLKKYDIVQMVKGKSVKRIFNKDYIEKASREDLFNIIRNTKENEKVIVTVLRDDKHKNIILRKKELKLRYFIDEIPFCASLTYINPKDYSFAAVAHNINFLNKNNILRDLGDIYLCDLCQIKKSNNSQVGNMYGKKVFDVQGNINKINQFGAKGKIVNKEILKNKEIYQVAKKEDVKIGSAQILIKDDNQQSKKNYEIKITKINIQNKPKTQSFEFEVIDNKLIEEYGGIVQGMSGCPIIQNGKIIGALSHVISANPKCGIGLYIEWMMEG